MRKLAPLLSLRHSVRSGWSPADRGAGSSKVDQGDRKKELRTVGNGAFLL